NMQYVLLIYDDPGQREDMAPEERESIYREHMAVSQLPNTRGGAQLQPTDTARRLRVETGETIATDRPVAETKETLGGCHLSEADSLDEAIEWASRVPSACTGAVEIRPVLQNPEHRE